MSLGPRQMTALDAAASRFASRNHERFLADALGVMKRLAGDATAAPLQALRVLSAMQGSAYASRDAERAALADVGHWLEQRLRQEPNVDAVALAVELGWLKRLVRYHAELHWDRRDRNRGRADRPRPFGKQIVELERRRRATTTRAAAAERRRECERPAEPEATRPAEMPPIVRVFFSEIGDVREARKQAAKRKKKGKPPKDRPLELRAADPDTLPVGIRLHASLARTQGLDEVFAAMESAGGATIPFLALDLDASHTEVAVLRVGVRPPMQSEERR